MHTLFSRFALLAVAGASLGLASCSNDDDDTSTQPAAELTTETMRNLAPVPAAPTSTGQPGTPRHFAFFSFATKGEIPYTDSATTKWDIAVRSTTILINGGSSGPGAGGAIVHQGLFSELTTAPTTGYKVDSPTVKAIPVNSPTSSGNGWYNYNSTKHVVSPIAGRVLLIRTATGKYAKVEIVSYYKDAPATPTGTEPNGYYTFRYVYQPDGSPNLK